VEEKIISRPLNEDGRDTWDRVFKRFEKAVDESAGINEKLLRPTEVQVVQHEDRQVRAPGDPEEPKGDTGRGSTGED